MRLSLKRIFSIEFLFALFLVVGSFKSALNIPFVDETLFLLIITGIAAIIGFVQKGMVIPKVHAIPLILFMLIILWALLSLTYTPSNYALEKLLRFGVISAWCYIGAFSLFRNMESIKRFLLGIVVLSLIMAVTLLTTGGSADSLQFQSVFGTSYVSMARVSAMGAIILLVYFLFAKTGNLKRYLSLAMALLLFVPLIQSGARLPVVLLGLVILTIPFSMVKFKKRDILISKRIFPLLGLILVIAGSFTMFVKAGYAETLVYRMEVMLNSEGGGASVEGRTERFDTALEMATSSYFLGKGLNSFSLYHQDMDGNDYPHSIYLEILSELGLIPMFIFIALIVIAIINGIKYYTKYGLNFVSASVYGLFLFWLFNSIGSSSMVNDKVFYALIAIMILLPYLGFRTEKEQLEPIKAKQKRKKYKLVW